jgi:Fe-S cluster assembly ATP-binding protein
MSVLTLDNLHAGTNAVAILKGLSLAVGQGEIHAIMGPNGAGKSTLAKVIGGHPAYAVTEGRVLLRGEDLLELDPSERAAKGLFMSFQYPVEVPGVTNQKFLQTAYNAQAKARGEVELSDEAFVAYVEEKLRRLEMPLTYLSRNLNEGFSGGEKKRNEILQMAVLNPLLAILDETDSGLDIDALRVVAEGIKALMTPDRGLILITHYQRLLDYVKPDHVHVMVDGRFVASGGPELAREVEARGYEWLGKQL